MNSHPFFLFLKYASAEMKTSHHKATATPTSADAGDEHDPFVDAMSMLDPDKRAALIGFIDHALSTVNDPKALAQIFDAGNLHFSWKTAEGPRLALLAIRKAALDLPRKGTDRSHP